MELLKKTPEAYHLTKPVPLNQDNKYLEKVPVEKCKANFEKWIRTNQIDT